MRAMFCWTIGDIIESGIILPMVVAIVGLLLVGWIKWKWRLRDPATLFEKLQKRVPEAYRDGLVLGMFFGHLCKLIEEEYQPKSWLRRLLEGKKK